MNLLSVAPRYVITLVNRPERLASASQQPDFRIFEAFDTKRYRFGVPPDCHPMCAAALGCMFSHLALIKLAKAQRYTAIIISEDDATFVPNFAPPPPPPDWQFIYFSSTVHNSRDLPITQVPNHPDYYHSVPTMGATAYAVHESAYDAILSAPQPCPIDVTYARLTTSLRCYTTFPFLAHQGRLPSHITGSKVLTPWEHILKYLKRTPPP